MNLAQPPQSVAGIEIFANRQDQLTDDNARFSTNLSQLCVLTFFSEFGMGFSIWDREPKRFFQFSSWMRHDRCQNLSARSG